MFPVDGSKSALVYQDQVLSYNGLRAAIAAAAEQHGSAVNERVVICAENRPEWIIAFYAIWQAGGIAVPVDVMSTQDEVAYILADCAPTRIYCSEKTRPLVTAAADQARIKSPVHLLETLPSAAGSSESVDFRKPDDNETAAIVYTSGTTGHPKGVMLSFLNLRTNVEAVSKKCPIFNTNDRVMALLPFHHVLPLVGTILVPLSIGATTVFCPSLEAAEIVKTLQQHQITMIIGVPRLYTLIRNGIRAKINASALARGLFSLAAGINRRGLSRILFGSVHRKFGGHMRHMVSGGAPLDPAVAHDFETLGFSLLNGYGMTETAPMITFPRPGRVNVQSVGEPVPGMEVRIQDGEVQARGPAVMQGYYEKPQETAEAFADGWLRTGDLGYFDDNGYLFITGRKKELIVLSNGKNINPVELEEKLERYTEVEEAAVLLNGDILHAIIRPFATLATMGTEVAEQRIRQDVVEHFNHGVSPAKRLMKVSVVFEELPRTRLGKLRRFALPDLAKESTRHTATPLPDFEKSPTYTALCDFLEKTKGITIQPTDHVEMDLGLDSLDRVSLLYFIKQTFGVDIDEPVLANCPTVKDLADYIEKHKSHLEIRTINWRDILRERTELKLPTGIFSLVLIQRTAGLLFRGIFRMQGRGMENLPDGPFILAPNHQSYLDGLFVVMFLTGRQMKQTYFYAKEKHVSNAFLRFMARTHNVIVVDMKHDLKESIQKLAEVLRQGGNVIIFPEGTRTHDGSLGEYKKTVAILSRELDVPVVPVVIDGAFKALPRGKHKVRCGTRISVQFLEPVPPGNADYDTLLNTYKERQARVLAGSAQPGEN